jgi:hypothetical protein
MPTVTRLRQAARLVAVVKGSVAVVVKVVGTAVGLPAGEVDRVARNVVAAVKGRGVPAAASQGSLLQARPLRPPGNTA